MLRIKLHSKLLVPFEIAKNGIDAVEEWIIKNQGMHRFKEGDEVAHKEFIEQKMFINQILKEKRMIPDGYDNQGKQKFKEVNRMIGIEVHFFEEIEENAKS